MTAVCCSQIVTVERRIVMRLKTLALYLLAIASQILISNAWAASLTSITLCRGVEEDGFNAVDVADTFATDTPDIHAVVVLDSVEANSVFKGTWVSVDAISVPDYAIDSYEAKFDKSGPAHIHISLSKPTNGWPQGNYRLDVDVDNNRIGSKTFKVVAAVKITNSNEDIVKKLEALDAALAAGILNREEYASKKARLEAELKVADSVPDEATRKKLQALEAAFQAGILSEDEYAKKKVLLGSKSEMNDPDNRISQSTRKEAAAVRQMSQERREGKTYRHPTGFSLWYPEAWKVTNQDGILQLVPPEAAVSEQGPLELYFVAAEDVGVELEQLDDARMIQYLDEQAKSLSPLLEYSGKTARIGTGMGDGAALLWRAESPAGQEIVARIFITSSKQTAVMLVAMGQKSSIDGRERDLKDMFSSMSFAEARIPLKYSVPAEAKPEAVAIREPQSGHSEGRDAPANFQDQLGALEKARQAGILDEAEYQEKKALVEQKRLEAMSPESKKKLDALEAAFKAGVISDQEYNDKKEQLLPQQAGARAQREPLAEIKGKRYQHVVGFSLWYPESWSVKELEDSLQLVPPNPGKTAQGEPTEVYLIVGDSVAGEGIAVPDDPRVVQHMDQVVTTISPFVKRVGASTPAKSPSGKGTVMNWQGKSPTGDLVLARAYVSIIKDHGIALLALCFKERLEAREADLQRIFASFAFGSGQMDPKLCGQWRFLTTQSITNWSPFETHYSRAQLAADTTGTLVFNSDGTWSRIDRTQMIVGAGDVWLESNEKQESRGTWYAGSGSLFMIWENNTWEDYTYEMRRTPQGLRLLLKTGEKGELWERAE